MYRLALSLLATFISGALFAGDFEISGMKSKVPAGWKEEQPANTMRMGQFKLAKVEGDPEDAEIAVFRFPSGSGTVDANLKRQLAKFKPAEGKEEPENKVEKIKVGKIEATYQDVKGTFLSKFPPFAPNAKITEKANFRQLYVIFTTDSGEYYLALLGPAKTVEKHKKEFEEWLTNFK
jgi:hypothetical protein